jgi:hypothetical protein
MGFLVFPGIFLLYLTPDAVFQHCPAYTNCDEADLYCHSYKLTAGGHRI